jgi:DivIVA domain-containing protein
MRRRKKKESGQETGLLSGEAASGLTPIDIQQKEFRLAFRGYRESDVDEFLDLLTEEFARLNEEVARVRDENRRLRDGAGLAPGAMLGGPDLSETTRTAEEVLQRARDQAAAIIRDAESRARTPALSPSRAGTPAGSLSPFLSREREFLQGLAGLIQRHAEFVKEAAAAARGGTAAPSFEERRTVGSPGPASPGFAGPVPAQAPPPPPPPPAIAGEDAGPPDRVEPALAQPPEAPPPEAEPGGPVGLFPPPELQPFPSEEPEPPWPPPAGEGAPRSGEGERDWQNPFAPGTGGRGGPAVPSPAEEEDERDARGSSSRFGSPVDRRSPPGEKGRTSRLPEEERSLRELFWGEE